jgi:hypothetical protein
MNRAYLALFLLFCLSITAYAQEQPPQLLVRTARCLAVKQFLPRSNVKVLNLGFIVDEKSYPGQKVLYLVDYAGPNRSRGLVFTVFLSEDSGRQALDIQNNASFILSKKYSEGVSFVEQPLGGIWTKEHLASAIKQIEKQTRFAIPVKDLFTVKQLIGCESYTDGFR